jgi:hypothetical protein
MLPNESGRGWTGARVGQHEHHAAGDPEHAQRDDERRQLAVGHERAVEHADGGAGGHADEDRRHDAAPCTSSSAVMQPVRPRTEPTERSMPAVRMTRSWPTAMMPKTGDLAGQVGHVVAGQELVGGQRQRAEEHEQDDQAAGVAPEDVAER